MFVRIGELRQMIAELGSRVSYDVWFKDDVMPSLRQRNLLPGSVGRFLDGGYEALVYEYGSDQVIRLQPTYEDGPEQVEKVFQRQLAAPQGQLFARIFDVGKIEGYDKELDNDITYAVFTIMERLNPIDRDDAETIDAVVTKKSDIADVPDQRLREFLRSYFEFEVDHDSRNVMMRGDDYVAIDPE